MSEVKWLTQDAHDAVTAELADRQGPVRQEIVRRIEAAREEGDLKENGGYHAAKDEQGKNEARIVLLRATLKNARIGTPESAPDEAAHGKVITVEFPALSMEQVFLLAAREEAPHTDMEVVSTDSPLGSAIDGHLVGDTVTYALPNGRQMQARITAVADQS